jgi:2-dehydropantoate 2-reductase
MSIHSIAVLGPGGVGGFLAAALARAGAGEVTVIARESTAAVISEAGVSVQSVRLGDFVAHPRAVRSLSGPVDVLIIATKALSLGDALERVAGVEPHLVVPLLNGLEHMAVLKERFGAEHVAAGSIRIEADRPAPAQITQTSPFLRIDLAADDPAAAAQLPGLADVLTAAQVPARIEPSEAEALWSKLVRLTALACTTSAADQTIGLIRSDPGWRAKLIGCIEEAAVVARAEGATADPAATIAELDDAHEGLGSSMRRDIAAGRVPELEAIPGAVLRAGVRHGLSCPTIASLAAIVAARAGLPAPRA